MEDAERSLTYDFETLVGREGTGSLKMTLTTDEIRAHGLIGFSGAEMDFPTAPVMREAIAQFARKGIYGFTLQDKAYDDAVIWWMEHSRGCKVESDDIIVTLGTIFALGIALRAFTQKNDGVILQRPVYCRYAGIIERNERRIVDNPLILNDDGSYSVDFADLEDKMSMADVKLLVLCNPQNPTAKVFGLEEQRKIASMARKHKVVVFSDEIFADINYTQHPIVPYFSVDSLFGISCTSLGKSFNFTGVNHANVFIRNPELRKKYLLQRNADHFGSIDPFFYQSVVSGYNTKGLNWINAMCGYVWNNYCYIKEFLSRYLKCIRISPLEGSFICWLDFRALGFRGKALDSFLREKALMMLDSGWEYGESGNGFARMNLACPRRYLVDAMERLKMTCDEESNSRLTEKG